MKTIGYYNGCYSELEDMYIPMNDRVCFFGDGVYDAAYCYNHKIFALDEHIERFFESVNSLKINLDIAKSELSNLIQNLVNKVDDDKLFVYWQATRGTARREHSFNGDIKGNLWIMIKHGELRDMTHKIKVLLKQDVRHSLCNIKTLNLIPNILAVQEAESQGAQEVIFHRNGLITECAHSNVSIIKDDRLITPIANNYILSGIGRAHLMNVCKAMGLGVEEKNFYIDDLYSADAIILTAAGSLCIEVGSIDKQIVGGKIPDLVNRIRGKLVTEFEDYTGVKIY